MDHQKAPEREPGINDSLLHGDERVVACLLLTTVENVRAIRREHEVWRCGFSHRAMRALRRCAIGIMSREGFWPRDADPVWLRSACRELSIDVADLFETPWQASGAGG